MDFSHSRFWFSWFPRVGTVSPSERVMLDAAESALKLITNDLTSHLRQLGYPKTLTKAIPDLRVSLNKSSQQCLIFGTLSPEQATRCSWDQLGLDLFSIKARQVKAGLARDEFLFKYIPLLPLTRLIEGLTMSSGPMAMEDRDLARIRIQLQLASCFTWIQQKRNLVAHGHRDRVQFQKPSSAVFGVEENERHCSSCSAIQQLKNWSTQFETIQASTAATDAYIPLVKNLANLDCQTAKFSSILSYNPSTKSFFPFDRIVIFEDDQQMKEHIIL